MKGKITLAVLSFLFSFQTFSQSPNWLWARGATGLDVQEGLGVATDASGNVYATGYFSSPVITFGTTTLTNSGGVTGDIFLIKYDGAGNVLWARSAGGTGNDDSFTVTTDAFGSVTGNVYITGFFNSPTITFGTTTLTNSGLNDIFIAKYDGAGNFLWAKSVGGNLSDKGVSGATDGFGNVFLTGNYSSAVTFGTTVLTNSGFNDIFLVKYDGAGNVVWAKSAGGAGDDFGLGAATDAAGNVFFTGRFTSAAITFGTTILTNTGSSNIFLVKYDGAGNMLWATSPQGTGADEGWSVITDASGNVFVTGCFTSPAITFGTTTLTNSGGGWKDVFITKYDGAGNVLWSKSGGGTLNDVGYDVATDNLGNVHLSGGFLSSSIAFDSHTLIYPPGSIDPMFAITYDPSGSILCAFALSSGGDDQNAIATDGFGNVFIGGDFYAVNPFIVGTDSLPLTGTENIFVAKYLCEVNSINEFSDAGKMILFPNPATTTIFIERNPANTPATLQLLDCFGRKVEEINLTAGGQESQRVAIDVSHIAAGIYFVRMADEKEQVVRKVVVQR